MKYLVRLNDTYMTEYEESTGYNDFGKKEDAVRFETADEALRALVDVLWGGSDEPPTVEEILK